jgi:DNA-binding CsgD family transcriptional regulator
VPGRMSVSESDLRRLMDVLDVARCGEPGAFLPNSVLTDLSDLIGCDDIHVMVMDPYRREWGGIQHACWMEDHGEEVRALFWLGFWEAYSYPQRSGDFVSVTRKGDRRLGVRLGPRWAAMQEATGCDPAEGGFCAMLPLAPEGTVDRRVTFWRDEGPDFSDRDVLLFSLLRPHVMAMFDRQRASRSGVPALTPRQWEILRLVAGGCTNGQVAHALALSEATVRKHLENIYVRLGVNSRIEALAKTNAFLADPEQPPLAATSRRLRGLPRRG